MPSIPFLQRYCLFRWANAAEARSVALHTLHCGVQYHKPGIHSCTRVLLPVCLTPRFIPVWITPSKNNPAQLLDNEQNHAAADLVISEAESLWQVYSWEGKWKFFLAFVRSPVTPAAQVTTARGRQHLNNTKLSHITFPPDSSCPHGWSEPYLWLHPESPYSRFRKTYPCSVTSMDLPSVGTFMVTTWCLPMTAGLG